jgi:hypothetical protein
MSPSSGCSPPPSASAALRKTAEEKHTVGPDFMLRSRNWAPGSNVVEYSVATGGVNGLPSRSTITYPVCATPTVGQRLSASRVRDR